MYSVQDSVKQGGRALIAKNFFGLKIYIERVGVLKITCDFFTFDFFSLKCPAFKRGKYDVAVEGIILYSPKKFAPCSFSLPPFPFLFPLSLKRENVSYIFPKRVWLVSCLSQNYQMKNKSREKEMKNIQPCCNRAPLLRWALQITADMKV